MTQFSVIIEKDEDGYYAHVPALQGCYAQGDTYEESLENIEDATKLYVEDLTASGQNIQKSSQIILTKIEIPDFSSSTAMPHE
ncbi:type II toxin-antitoxin system HicB family antitoxin [Methanogenium marinum]|uniref:Type II toxin-antitoxin system HicB family antitoxin n=1 Tax=Methanogenium marinum TaxID=348610 RepID=A0A9Q4KPI9_9EURY|nr:type II toxin-antitoxin system HicB family antitoxin [Methanogenium marinum]MDE4908193.1 type II toxin-antitoxin system HicB family antitoxin [Methanogenium marinum]